MHLMWYIWILITRLIFPHSDFHFIKKKTSPSWFEWGHSHMDPQLAERLETKAALTWGRLVVENCQNQLQDLIQVHG